MTPHFRLYTSRGSVTIGTSYESSVAEWCWLSLDDLIYLRKVIKNNYKGMRKWLHTNSAHPNPTCACSELDTAVSYLDRYIAEKAEAEDRTSDLADLLADTEPRWITLELLWRS